MSETDDGAIVTIERYAYCGPVGQHLAIHVVGGSCRRVAKGAYPREASGSVTGDRAVRFVGEQFKPSNGAAYEVILHQTVDSELDITWRQPIEVRP